ncbi:hypothetical protein [Haloferax volcanii]|uniref:Uncharacterized protein n=3 Tax=Haloferax volcanii TaxID=2246 RepID=D4GXG8_HALVD|nr:hypothetical protein [Haloferax volcanii]ADE04283.1 uncharacterized protein HVO_1316 [Haloferax volcanii DS2]ELY27996.1 hypothetical protein C498_12153 [Haloferax volcanii DS2]MBS8117756.1 hypothetical protein [Haloferax volcanii]MBS8122768.1 hypothetical protein [Haloferax volcanii]MBS8126636.1 hypothetical protein [Haloferax volcanii]
MNRDELNDYLKQRPLLGGLWLVAMLGVAMVLWLKLLRPGQSVVDIVSNTGYQFVFLVTGGLCYVTYVGFSRAVN